MKRFFLVDPAPVMRLGLAALLERQAGYEVCGSLGSVREAIQAIPGAQPDLVITDISLEDLSGLELIKELHTLCPTLPVFVYSMHDEMLFAQRSIQAGGRGYLMKCSAPELLLQAIRQVLKGNIHLSQRVSNHLLGSFAMPSHSRNRDSRINVLSDRELEVFELIGRGRSTHDIADQLCLCLRTVEAHRTHIREKLELESATDVVRHAVVWVESQT